MPLAAIPAAIWIGAAGAGASAAAGIYGAKKSSEATSHAADIQSQSNQAAIEEQKRQDAIQLQEFNQQQAALKAQWDAQQALRAPYRAAGASALSNLGNILGTNFGAPNTSSDLSAPSGPSTSSSGGGPTPQGIDWTAPPDKLTASLNAYFTAAGKPTTETPYWVSQAQALVQRGQQLNDPNYPNKRLQAADIFGGASSATPTTPISSLMGQPPLAPQMSPVSGNPLAPNYNQVIPISALMGAR